MNIRIDTSGPEWQRMVRKYDGRVGRKRFMEKEAIAEAYMQMVKEQGGKPLSRTAFLQKTLLPENIWSGGHWRSWAHFQFELGLEPTLQAKRTPDEVLLRRFAELALKLNKLPSLADFRMERRKDPTLPCYDCFHRMAQREELLTMVELFCEDKPEFTPVTELLRQRRAIFMTRKREQKRKRCQGFVYLLRGGEVRMFRLGAARAHGSEFIRKTKALSLRPETVHMIDTDDPEGIEDYWRRRFSRQHLKDNLYRLDSNDLMAFRRRKYQ